MLYRYKVIVKLKNGIKDARGEAVSTVIKNINSKYQCPNVSVGKYFEFDIEDIDADIAKKKGIDIIEEVFVNPILETYYILEVETL